MDTLREIFAPDFLLRNSLYASILIGLVCPLAGIFLVLRRLVFMGVAMPQVSSTGVALALSLHILTGHAGSGHGESQHWLACAGSIGLTLVTILVLAWLERRGKGGAEARLGTVYVVAMAASILLLAKCPTAEQGWLGMLKGEIVSVSTADLGITLAAFIPVAVCLLLFQKEFLLVSFDRDMAITLQKNTLGWDTLLFLLIGLVISVTVLSAGPLVAFGFLLIPPLISRPFARNMRQYVTLSVIVGGLVAVSGFALAYRLDLPVGPTDVALLGALFALTYPLRRLWLRLKETLAH